MKTKTILISITVVLMSACSVKLMDLTQTDAERGSAKFKGATLETLNQGKSIFQENCNECHGLKRPSSRTEERWNKIVPTMVKKLNLKMGKEVIDAKKQELLLQYLVTMSIVPKK